MKTKFLVNKIDSCLHWPILALLVFSALMPANSQAGVPFRTIAEMPAAGPAAVDWPEFLVKHDMHFDQLPQSWQEAPHFGNAMLGSMLYQEGEALKLQVFRADVHDHRDQSHGWPAYSRPRLQIGHFLLNPVGKLIGCEWHKDLWNAELTGVIRTDRGEIRIRHFVHADDMAIVTELIPSEGEEGYTWSWHPMEAKTTRAGYPTDQASLERFANKYGDHYRDTLVLNQPNPPGRLETREQAKVWVQDFLFGGQYATAWSEDRTGELRRMVVSIGHTYPERSAADQAVADVAQAHAEEQSQWIAAHHDWWHEYYPQSFVSIPDSSLESLYWQTIYRYGCTSRTGRAFVDTSGIWFQGFSWPYITTDWNIQSAHWPVYTANRLEQGREVVERLHEKQDELIQAVLPEAWREDSAFLPLAVAGDLRGSRDDDKRYYDLVGNLPWTMHNAWLQYRYSMDEAMLRNTVFPILRRSINFYLHMIVESEDGHLRLPPTFSPETGVWKDSNFDLALLKWGCHTLLQASARLGIDDSLIPRWKEVIARLPDYPYDEHGYMLGSDETSSPNHQHFSNLLMIYPLYLVNVEQPNHPFDVMERSLQRALSTAGPGQRQGMVQAHAGLIATAIGLGNEALFSLKSLQGDLFPNGLWYESPCIESTLAAANIIQDMMLQSWSDPAAKEPGAIRIFPAMPDEWKEAEFHDLRAEGAFLVSAKRAGGQLEWVRIKSLAGEPCRVKADFGGQPMGADVKEVSPGVYEIDLSEGEEVLLLPAAK